MIFSEKNVIVTGAAQGIGKAIAMAFAREGANLVLADTKYKKLQETAAEAEKFGRNSLCLSIDVTVPRQVKEMVVTADSTFLPYHRFEWTLHGGKSGGRAYM